jgi:hypothetical protein
VCTATDSTGNKTNCSFRVIVLCDCISVKQDQITSNSSGQLNYSFTFQNLSGVPVKYIFLLPQTNCMSVTPDILTLTPPLLPGATTNLSVVLQGACLTNRCFTFSAHDTNLVQCCSLIHCVPASSRPILHISRVGTNVILSWPDSFSTFQLQSANSIAAPIDWFNVTNNPVPTNGNLEITLPAGQRAQFYRLQGP